MWIHTEPMGECKVLISSPPHCSHPSLPLLPPLTFFMILFPPSSSFVLILLIVLPSSLFSPPHCSAVVLILVVVPTCLPLAPSLWYPSSVPIPVPVPLPLPLPLFPLWFIPSVPLTSCCHAWFIVIPIPVAPHFHPMSSCSWQQFGVLWWWCGGEGGHHHCHHCCCPHCGSHIIVS
jgi:hypothetical protein